MSPSNKWLIQIGLIICALPATLSLAQTYPSSPNTLPNTLPNNNHQNKTNPIFNNKSVSNGTQQNNQVSQPNSLQPNIIISYPMNSTGATPANNSNVGAGANKRVQPEKPSSTGYDTTSSVGGPANDQGSITYGSNGSIKTQPPMKAN